MRLRPPGSEWLFVKLYLPRALEDDVLANSLFDIAEDAVASGMAEEWFFIRYADPDAHIRLRLRSGPTTVAADLLRHVCEWATGLMQAGVCLRFGFDTYDRELERYGGSAGMAIAESIFFADSRAVCRLLRLIQTHRLALEPRLLAVLSIDDLLAGLGLDESARHSWYCMAVPRRDDTGEEYRQVKVLLRTLLGAPTSLASQAGGQQVLDVLADRRQALAHCAERLQAAHRRSEVPQPLDALLRSYVHLHCNRLAGHDASIERRALGLLRRTRDGLERAPHRQ
jgi:thiopeptide-type bacteriocin biosynthesis protein